MPFDQDTAADELGRAFAAMVKAARVSPDMADLWRAFAELHARDSAHGHDSRAMRDDGAFLEDGALALDEAEPSREKPTAADPVVFTTRIGAMLATSAMRFGLRWQELLLRRIPPIRRRLDEFRSEEDPSPELRWKLVDEVRQLLREIGEFAADQGSELQERLNKLEYDLLPGRWDGANGQDGKRRRVTKRKHDDP